MSRPAAARPPQTGEADPEREPPRLLLPEAGSIFRRRSARLHDLAAKTPSLAGYLGLMADLAEIQQVLTGALVEEGGATDGWHEVLRTIARRLIPRQPSLTQLLNRLEQASEQDLENWAEPLLSMNPAAVDAALGPFVAAALQVQRTASAARLGPIDPPPFLHSPSKEAVSPDQPEHLCPVCGFLPAASMLQSSGDIQGLRYLACGLCGTEWRQPRSQCVHCGSGKDVSYYGIEGGDEAVKAEACGDCRAYLKVMNRGKDPLVDPVADDLATLSLDLLMAEQGYRRLGFNPLLIPGA